MVVPGSGAASHELVDGHLEDGHATPTTSGRERRRRFLGAGLPGQPRLHPRHHRGHGPAAGGHADAGLPGLIGEPVGPFRCTTVESPIGRGKELTMKPRVLAVLALAALLLVVPTVAQAKGATAATIDGGGPGGLPGGPITLRGDGEPGSGTDLGIRQHVYPYAATGPVTFMPAGQRIFDDTTRGGWYQATDSLHQQLISLGLPDRKALGSAASPQPPPATPTSRPATLPRVAAVVAGLLLLTTGAAVVLRRRPRTTTAH